MSTKRSRVRQWISVLLIVGMLVTALPTVAYADTEGSSPASPDTPETTTVTNTRSFDAVQSAIVRKGQHSNTVQELNGGCLMLKNNNNPNDTREGYIQFDLSNATLNVADITQVRLELYAFQEKAKNPQNIKVKVSAVTSEEWNKDTIKGANAPAAGNWIATTATIDRSGAVYTLDVTKYVMSKCSSGNGGTKISFLLSSDAADTYGEIYVPTEQYSTVNCRPKLVVESTATNEITPDIDYEPCSKSEYQKVEEEWKNSEKTKKIHRSTMKGSGTVSDPYLIYTAADLMSMAENDNSCYKLMRDIDLKGISWRPVGYYYWYPFMGYLDGNGHKITNLYVGGTQNDAWNINAGGLFGYFEGRVENLGVETVKAERKGIDFFGTAGGIAGVTNAPAEIINCYFNGYVAGAGYAGGLVGISYPGTVIENCCALGTVDMSQGFEYLNDNNVQWYRDCFNVGMEMASWAAGMIADFAQDIALGDVVKAICDIFKNLGSSFSDMSSIYDTGYITSIRKCSIGGLVGLNYGRIYNSYASNKLYNIKAGYNSYKTKVGPITGRNMENGGAEVSMCYFNSDIDNAWEVDVLDQFRKCGKNTATIKKGSTLDDELKGQWNFSTKALSNKSTGGLPLPKINKVSRKMRTKGGKTDQPEVYYQSRVLMKTRENFIIGDEVSHQKTTNNNTVITTAIKCTVCAELVESGKRNDNHCAVTGLYQRGSVSQPYHVHDIDSLLAMQDNKESHFILCSDIDLKVTDGTNTVQKYWWPAGKTHFSPIKGSLKGNVSINQNRISITKKAKPTDNASDVFTIKNLTVQHDKHVGLFASLRGTVSDINIELTSDNPDDKTDDWKSWRDGIRRFKPDRDGPTIVGISTIGEKSSAGVIAGETVTGALIRDCNVGGRGCGDNVRNEDTKKDSNALKIPYEKGDLYGVVKGSLRAGGIVGLLNRGARMTGCSAYICADADNYDIHFGEDAFGHYINIISAGGKTVSNLAVSVESICDLVSNWDKFFSKKSTKGDIKDNAAALENIDKAAGTNSIKIGKAKYVSQWVNATLGGLFSVFTPLTNLWLEKYAPVCTGLLVGESYGAIKNATAYNTPILDGEWWLDDGELIGYFSFGNSTDNVGSSNIMASADESTNVSSIFQKYRKEIEYDYYRENNITLCSIASTRAGIRGKGTEREPIKVKTEADLRLIASMLAEGYTFEGDYIEQADNIKLTGDFECMGLSSGTPFRGVYNGNECRIENLNIAGNNTAALFYKLEGACVYDLSIVNGRFTAPNAAPLAAEVTGESLILNCSSDSVINVVGDGPRDSTAGGLVLTLDNSYIGNSYALGTISSNTDAAAGGFAHRVQGTSELANCYTAVTLQGEKIIGYGIAAYVQDKESGGDCCLHNCYWPLDIISSPSASANRPWSHICRKEAGISPNVTGYIRSELNSQSLVSKLNDSDKLCNDCYISMSDNREWMQTKAGEYPIFKADKCSLKVIQPEVGEIIAERVFYNGKEYTYTAITEPMIPIDITVRFTLKNLPDYKKVDYWTLNGEKISNTSGKTSIDVGRVCKNSVFAVVLKDIVPLEEQTRIVQLKASPDSTVRLQIIDEYNNANPQSCEVGIHGYIITEKGKEDQKIGVRKEDNSTRVFENDIISIDVYSYPDQIYNITVPYGAKVILTNTVDDPNTYTFDKYAITRGAEKTYAYKKDLDSSGSYHLQVYEGCILEMFFNELSYKK